MVDICSGWGVCTGDCAFHYFHSRDSIGSGESGEVAESGVTKSKRNQNLKLKKMQKIIPIILLLSICLYGFSQKPKLKEQKNSAVITEIKIPMESKFWT